MRQEINYIDFSKWKLNALKNLFLAIIFTSYRSLVDQWQRAFPYWLSVLGSVGFSPHPASHQHHGTFVCFLGSLSFCVICPKSLCEVLGNIAARWATAWVGMFGFFQSYVHGSDFCCPYNDHFLSLTSGRLSQFLNWQLNRIITMCISNFLNSQLSLFLKKEVSIPFCGRERYIRGGS